MKDSAFSIILGVAVIIIVGIASISFSSTQKEIEPKALTYTSPPNTIYLSLDEIIQIYKLGYESGRVNVYTTTSKEQSDSLYRLELKYFSQGMKYNF